MKIGITSGSEMEEVVSNLRTIVSKYFSIEDVRWNDQAIAFYIIVDDERLDVSFDHLRKEMIAKGFVPSLTREYNDYIIYITRKPAIEPRSVKVNILMFILTVISTIWAGAVLWVPRTDFEMSTDSFGANLSDMVATLADPELVGFGALFFALPLMAILGIHELGHYFMSKKHGVDASLPFFIPIPPFIGPLGTFGAFISMREPMPSKRALIDIGAAGPIAGFIVAIPVTLIGLALTSRYPLEPGQSGDFITYLGSPLIFDGLKAIIPIPSDSMVHPTAFAGWVGLLVTSMNLLPAGQLDGGHIVRALFGKNSKYVSYTVVLILLVLGFQFAGWWVFTFLILMLGTSHPPPLNDITKLTPRRKMIGAFSVVMLVICFVPIPIMIEEATVPAFELDVVDDEIVAGMNESVNFTILIHNMGKEKDTYYPNAFMSILRSENPQDAHLIIGTLDPNIDDDQFGSISGEGNESGAVWVILFEAESIVVQKRSEVEFTVQVRVPAEAELGDIFKFTLEFTSKSNKDYKKMIELSVVVGELSLRFEKKMSMIHIDNITRFRIDVKNTGSRMLTVVLNATLNKTAEDMMEGWPAPILTLMEVTLGPSESDMIHLEVTAPDSAEVDDYIIIDIVAMDKFDPSISDIASFEVIVD